MDLKDIKRQVSEYKALQLHRIIGNSNGFFSFYYENLKNFKTHNAAFDYVNQLYYELFGEYKYNSYNSFRNSLERFNKQKNEK